MKQVTMTWVGATLVALSLAACAPKADKPADKPAAANGAAPAAAAPLTIKFGSDATYAPFEFTSPSGEITGFDIDLAKAMCEELKATCTFQNQDWDGIIPSLLAKKYDVIASSMNITEERKKSVAFTQKIWNAPNKFVAKAGSTLQTTPEGLKGKLLGVQQGTIQDDYATKYFKDAVIKRYKTLEAAQKDLVNNRVEVVFADGVTVSDGFLKTPAGKGFAQVGADVPSSADPAILGDGTGFAVRKEDTALLASLNKAFEAIRANGKYNEIAKKYFDFDIYGK